MNESRVSYAVRTIEALCHLVRSSKCDDDMKSKLNYLAYQMLQMVWDVEAKSILAPGRNAQNTYQVQMFWDEVAKRLGKETVYYFEAVYNGSINPKGELGVYIKIQPVGLAELLTITLVEP